MNYQKADSMLQGRNAQSRKISYSCRLERRADGVIVVKMHATDIITLFPDGRAVVDVGTWKTVTTKARLNDFMPFGRVWSDRGMWYLHVANAPDESRTYAFANGMTLNPDGTVTGALDETQVRAANALRKSAAKYARDFVAALVRGEVKQPDAGDCLYCQSGVIQQSGKEIPARTLGEAFGDSDHIRSHIEERYYVPSLAFRAVETYANSAVCRGALAGAVGMVPAEQTFRFDAYVQTQVQKAIRRYTQRAG